MLKLLQSHVRSAAFLSLFTCFFLSSNCAVSTYQKGLNHLNKNEYTPAIELLEQAEVDNPEDDRIKRDLGVGYYKTKRIDEAIEKLSQAKTIQPTDGKTIFYLGLSYEKQGLLDKAIGEYKNYVELSRSKYFKQNIAIRIKQLNSEQITRAVAQSFAQEKAIEVESIPANSVAVLYFQNFSDKAELNPLQKGLTQMLITDLAKAKQLRVVERLRLQRLLEELKLGTTGMVEKDSSPRVGKLIGASKLVQGGFTSLTDENLRIDASLAETASTEVSNIDEITGELNAIFKMEKNLAFEIIDELGVELTQEEREAIKKVQTESLLAFIAYSRGLDFEDRKMFTEAHAEYEKALELDPAFGLAKQNLEEVDMAKKAAETPKMETAELESDFESHFDEALGANRTSRLLNTSFAAQNGQISHGDNDTREALQEGTGSDNATLNNAVVPIVIPLPRNN